MKTQEIDNSFESIDIKKYTFNDFNICEIENDKSYTIIVNTQSAIGYTETPVDSYFTTSKLFYTNGNIWKKGLFFNNDGFNYHTWYEFDTAGKLIKSENDDDDYQFKFEDILEYCKENDIPVTIGPIKQASGYHTMIDRYYSEDYNKYVWEIQKVIHVLKFEMIILDANNGDELSREDVINTIH